MGELYINNKHGSMTAKTISSRKKDTRKMNYPEELPREHDIHAQFRAGRGGVVYRTPHWSMYKDVTLKQIDEEDDFYRYQTSTAPSRFKTYLATIQPSYSQNRCFAAFQRGVLCTLKMMFIHIFALQLLYHIESYSST